MLTLIVIGLVVLAGFLAYQGYQRWANGNPVTRPPLTLPEETTEIKAAVQADIDAANTEVKTVVADVQKTVVTAETKVDSEAKKTVVP